MKKIALIAFTFCFVLSSNVVFAKAHKKKSHTQKRVSRHFKKTKKIKKLHKHGQGPDLKDITNKSDYKEAPNNGVNSIENK